jgi:divalent metal cation (Fe/Co/Zn/Cd) transporter
MDVKTALYKKALYLSFFTIFYNMAEGLVSIFLGYEDEVLTLFGFGIDSFIEVLSGIGIAVMILRIRQNPETSKSEFEKTALKITGVGFYVLSAGLLTGIIINIITAHKPVTTFWGLIISIISIIVMTWLMLSKRSVGLKLQSEPILSDSSCTRVCIYMSVILLASSLIYELTGFAYADAIGSGGLIFFSISEGREAFEKARGKDCCCQDFS